MIIDFKTGVGFEIARMGYGPKEFRDPRSVGRIADTLWIADLASRRISLFRIGAVVEWLSTISPTAGEEGLALPLAYLGEGRVLRLGSVVDRVSGDVRYRVWTRGSGEAGWSMLSMAVPGPTISVPTRGGAPMRVAHPFRGTVPFAVSSNGGWVGVADTLSSISGEGIDVRVSVRSATMPPDSLLFRVCSLDPASSYHAHLGRFLQEKAPSYSDMWSPDRLERELTRITRRWKSEPILAALLVGNDGSVWVSVASGPDLVPVWAYETTSGEVGRFNTRSGFKGLRVESVPGGWKLWGSMDGERLGHYWIPARASP